MRGLTVLSAACVMALAPLACGESRSITTGSGPAPDAGTSTAGGPGDAGPADTGGLCPIQAALCEGQPAVGAPTLSDPVQVIPSAALPPEIVDQPSNNNLDIVLHDCRLFVAFRTAPSHFASDKTALWVMSTADLKTWSFERRVFMGTDLREPRLLSWGGRLFLYFAVLGSDPADFTPKGMMVTRYEGPGKWTRPEYFYQPGFIPWRSKVVGGVPYLVTYVGGENIYDENGKPIDVFWLTTADGVEWTPVDPAHAVVLKGGASETDFEFLDDGTLVAVARNEAGDGKVWGSFVCRGEKDKSADWTCKADPRKYDSPLVFKHGNGVYLIGRRNVTDDGYYDLGAADPSYRRLSAADQTQKYSIDYWNKPKRCSLWSVDPVNLSVSFILDLPSRGDTCFAGLAPLCRGRYLIYDYSSPIDGPDVSWIEGQNGRTNIYSQVLSLP